MYQIYNHIENNVDTLCLILGEKVSLTPNAMLIRLMLSEAFQDPPLIDGGEEGR